ncbi:MAG: hypothetical protein B6245_18290 [Desulfobacteraceae bacterium 4572_88]|nr:MAG: hypothetical protein B6245_18290 [Desulfobacteraceae bacterium 4572_88]
MKVYIELDDELRELPADNEMDISDILENEGIDAEIRTGVVPYQEEDGARTKNLTPELILAGAGGMMTASFAISKVLRELHRKPIYETWEELEEIRDADGKVLTNKKGEPMMKTVRKHVFIDPDKGSKKDQVEMTTP